MKTSNEQQYITSTASADKKPRIITSGIALGVALFLLSLTIFCALLPAQNDHDASRNYGYVYSGAKSNSVAFNTAADAEDSVFVFGSSELSTPSSVIAQVPSAVFGENDYGIDLTYIGEAYDQSLWHSMALAAYAPFVNEDRKVILIISPTWFEDAGIDESTFKMRFSYSLYRAFCKNPNISQSSKNYLAERLAYYGIDQTTIQAGRGDSPVDVLNNAVFMWADDIKLRKELLDIREKGIPVADSSVTEQPDFDALHYQALTDAALNSTNNAWGLDDDFYAKNIEGKLEALQGTLAQEHFANSEEMNDFSFMLKICKELDLEPLVIVPPVHGQFYDHAGSSATDRQACYERILKLCKANDVAVADFTDREYEKYFLHDIVHFGNTGWVEAERAIYSFITEDDEGER